MGGGLGHAYFAYLGGVQNLVKPAYIILERSLQGLSIEVFFFIPLLNLAKNAL